MKEVIKFNLKGISGILRKPDSNVIYFSYNNIHKIALLGIIGAIIGENGYNYNSLFKEKEYELPDFYKNLKELKIAIEPNAENLIFTKKIQSFNNSIGYASKEEGNNLIVTEQWIEKPSWNIYLLDDNSIYYNKLKEYLLNKKCEYIPYIGKNDHFANISDIEIFKEVEESKEISNINSLFADINYKISDDFLDILLGFNDVDEVKFEYKEVLPTSLNSKIGYTDFKEFTYTNKNIIIDKIDKIYNVNGKNIFFF